MPVMTEQDLDSFLAREFPIVHQDIRIEEVRDMGAVSYTHLTLPTICSV